MATPSPRRRCRGQSSVEYLLLLCSILVVVQLVGFFLQRYVPQIVDALLDKILTGAINLATG